MRMMGGNENDGNNDRSLIDQEKLPYGKRPLDARRDDSRA